jgi:hypothetical protein
MFHSMLQFAENATLMFLCHADTGIAHEHSRMSSRCRWSVIYRLYNIGGRTELWGTPAASFLGVENLPSTNTLNFLSIRKAIRLIRLVENSYSDNLYIRPECHVVSKAFSISKERSRCWHITVENYSDVIRQPHTLKYHAVSCSKAKLIFFCKFLFSVCFWIVLKIKFSNGLPVVDKRLIGHKFGGNFGSLPSFGSYNFCFLPRCWEVIKPKTVIE